MDNLEQYIDEAEMKILDIVEVAMSIEKYNVVKRHVQNTFGRNGLKGKLGLDWRGKHHNEKANRKSNDSLSKGNTLYAGKRRYPNGSNQENQSHQ